MSTTDSETNTTRDLRPRKYQEEIFERAQKENVIAALNTGSGKTLIGLLLIKWISALERSKDKLIIFLVPRVALVEQQANYLSDNTPLRVSKLFGALEIELSDRMRWRRRLEQCDVVVMTPQILVNLITHSLWSLQRVSLLVFDECHHTRKNHPYNIIMREYLHIKVMERPRIFGMTASPIWNMKDPVGSLLALETSMDSTIISVREHVEELAAHVPRPLELIKVYSLPPPTYNFHEPTLFQYFSIISPPTWNYIEVPWSNLANRYDATLYNLGPYCASLYLFLEIRHALQRMRFELLITDLMEVETVDIVSTPNISKKAPEDLALMHDLISDFEMFFWSTGNPNVIPIPLPDTWCTPKLNALKDILLEFYTPNFQVIVFVEQRQVAACLSKALPAMPELKNKIRSAHLVGQGANVDGVSKTTDAYHGDAIEEFKKGKTNVLIATSVAEEGLDFPACDLVIRFDPFKHMVAYVQSRGRARNAASRFVVMIRQDDQEAFNLYQSLQEHEPQMNRAYQLRHRATTLSERIDADDGDEEELDPADLAGRERYVVPTTGAVLTYDNAIGLLSYLCALIPCDAYTPPHKPKFVDDFQSTVKLPLSIPLLPEQLTYTGPPKHSKKEAKRAVAFMAVKRLHELDVFDEYLLPTPEKTLGEEEMAYIQLALQPQPTPVIINVHVKYPWTMGERLWLHPVYIKGEPTAGLVSGVPLPPVEVRSDVLLRLGSPRLLHLVEEEEMNRRREMHEYTRLGIFYRITGSPLANALGAYLIPLTDDLEVDFDKIHRLVDNPRGISDWSEVQNHDGERLLVLNWPEYGRTRVLQRVRNDLSPLSPPPEGSPEAAYTTYHEYWVSRWLKPGRTKLVLPTIGPLLEAPRLVKCANSRYPLDPGHRIPPVRPDTLVSSVVPMYTCGWVDMSPGMIRAFELFPALCHKLTDVYRAQTIRLHVGLPLIPDNFLIEALTLPSVGAGFSNQRLETLGDAVLDICTTVHLMIKYPRRHEGQLSALRQRVVSNKFLVTCARSVELERFVSSESNSVAKWPFVERDGYADKEFRERKTVTRQIPRRGLQDSVEALLGASFLAGGVPMALRTGVALGLSFGGLRPWGERVRETEERGPGVPALIVNLQRDLGYTFDNPDLLVEALTHPSFEFSTTPSYQRLEFLGDSVIKMVVTIYLFNKFPEATSHQLALPRTKSICSPALASLGVRKLKVHKYLLHNSIDLNHAINLYTPILQSTSAEEIVRRGWRYDPPKAMSDVFESVVGAVFVDSGYDLDRTGVIVICLMEDVLEALSPSIPKDPVSELLEWLASVGCSGNMKFRKTAGQKDGMAAEGISAVYHETVIAGPIISNSKNVARFASAEKALAALRDTGGGNLLEKLCDCKRRMTVDSQNKDLGADQRSDEEIDALDEEEEAEVAQMLNEEEFF